MNHFKQTLQLDQSTELAVVGRSIHVVASSGEFELIIGDERISIDKGTTYKTTQFENIRIINKHVTTNSIDLLIGDGDYTPPLKLVGEVDSKDILGEGALFNVFTLTGGAQKILDYATDRNKITIKNDNQTNDISIGRVDIASTGGYVLKPNQELTVKRSPVLEIWAMGAGNVSVLEEFYDPKS